MFNFNEYQIEQITTSLVDTLFLLAITGFFLILLGGLLGIVLYLTELNLKNKRRNIILNKVIALIVDFFRSIPFIILMIVLIPVTVWLMKTMIGKEAALPALILSASPFYARVFYNALNEVPKGNIEALVAMGISPYKRIVYIIKEALPALIKGLTVALVTLVGFISSAGAIGAGGLGDLAKREAFRGEYNMMIVSIILILIIVFSIQYIGDYVSKKIDRR